MGHPITQQRALLIGFATVAFGVTTLLRKVALNHINPVQFEVVSGAVHLALVPLYLYLLSDVLKPSAWDAKGIIVTAIAIAINCVASLAFMYALQLRNDVGVVGAMVSASPVITLMLSALFLGEAPSLRSVVGIGMVLVGVLLASK